MRCHNCSTSIEVRPGTPIARHAECPTCAAELHCCLNCRFYDAAAPNQCREPQAEWVARKERANFCGFFTPQTEGEGKRPPKTSKETARDQLKRLFKK